jgi:glutamyl/glutaminyl-tRNA synthetase
MKADLAWLGLNWDEGEGRRQQQQQQQWHYWRMQSLHCRAAAGGNCWQSSTLQTLLSHATQPALRC